MGTSYGVRWLGHVRPPWLFNVAHEGSHTAILRKGFEDPEDHFHCVDCIPVLLFDDHQAGLSHFLFGWKIVLTPLALCIILVVDSMFAHVKDVLGVFQ